MTSAEFGGFEHLNTVEALLRAKGGRIGQQGAAVVRRSAHAIEGTAQQFAPVDTGATRNSIGTDFYGDGRFGQFAAEIGPTTEYSPMLEFGTAHMGPHAFVGPALDRHSGDYVAAMEQLADPFSGGP